MSWLDVWPYTCSFSGAIMSREYSQWAMFRDESRVFLYVLSLHAMVPYRMSKDKVATMQCSHLYLYHFIVITNFETENKYRIRNTLGQQIYFATERKLNIWARNE